MPSAEAPLAAVAQKRANKIAAGTIEPDSPWTRFTNGGREHYEISKKDSADGTTRRQLEEPAEGVNDEKPIAEKKIDFFNTQYARLLRQLPMGFVASGASPSGFSGLGFASSGVERAARRAQAWAAAPAAVAISGAEGPNAGTVNGRYELAERGAYRKVGATGPPRWLFIAMNERETSNVACERHREQGREQGGRLGVLRGQRRRGAAGGRWGAVEGA